MIVIPSLRSRTSLSEAKNLILRAEWRSFAPLRVT